MTGRRILVTGTDEPLGAAVSARLRRQRDVSVVELPAGRAAYDDVAEVVREEQIDTIVHAALARWSPQVDADVIVTMRLAAAAAQPGSAVRTVTAASSVAVYGASSRAPRVRRESGPLEPPAGSAAARLLEAERYLTTLAEANPHVCVSVLRVADLAGARPQGALSTMLLGPRPLVPVVAGFDPSIQLLDLDDAAAALEHAAQRSLAGVYNVAASGNALRWSQAIRLAGKRPLPFVAPPPWVASAAARIGLPVLAPDALDVLRFGRVVDTTLFDSTGFVPARTSEACASALTAGTSGTSTSSDPTRRRAGSHART